MFLIKYLNYFTRLSKIIIIYNLLFLFKGFYSSFKLIIKLEDYIL